MEMKEIADLLVNSSTAIAVIVYFMVRDWKFTTQLNETLTTIKNLLEKENEK